MSWKYSGDFFTCCCTLHLLCERFKINVETEGKIEAGKHALFCAAGGAALIWGTYCAPVHTRLNSRLGEHSQKASAGCPVWTLPVPPTTSLAVVITHMCMSVKAFSHQMWAFTSQNDVTMQMIKWQPSSVSMLLVMTCSLLTPVTPAVLGLLESRVFLVPFPDTISLAACSHFLFLSKPVCSSLPPPPPLSPHPHPPHPPFPLSSCIPLTNVPSFLITAILPLPPPHLRSSVLWPLLALNPTPHFHHSFLPLLLWWLCGCWCGHAGLPDRVLHARPV